MGKGNWRRFQQPPKDGHNAKSTGNSRKRKNDQGDPDSISTKKKQQKLNIEAKYLPKDTMSRVNQGDSEDEMEMARDLNKQKNKKSNKSGGFQSMGLSYGVLKGILRRGYKIPTPIQRKTIPIILERKDVVAMARTGSGKTAAFLIPMFDRLKTHHSSGVRAIIMSPTRELALQTLKFAKEIGKFTNLKAAVILGGDKMDDQFAALHENPDIVIATPGRFLHVLVEMELKLKSVEYVVFDEADRLYEMGFQDQLQELLNRLPEARQTLLFSATLPKSLVDFAKAGLTDPVLIRLDVDSKLSENLTMAFLHCRDADKLALLMHMLKHVISPGEQTIVFAATKHHVEFLHLLLKQAGLSNTYIYSSLDPTARKINAAKFSLGKCKILIVTDLAARGIDVPLLDNVINFNFPAKPKLFVHRVGRVARAGRSGVAYSLVCPDEMPHVVDLHVFLGRPLKPAILGQDAEDESGTMGEVPQCLLDDEEAIVRQLIKDSADLTGLEKVCSNAYRKYITSRPPPASDSIRRVKRLAIDGVKLGVHPMFKGVAAEEQGLRLEMINALKSYKPKSTIFEINSTNKKASFEIMKAKRELHEDIIRTNEARRKEKEEAEALGNDHLAASTSSFSSFSSSTFTTENVMSGFSTTKKSDVMEADDEEISAVFGQVVTSRKKYARDSKKRKHDGEVKDKENFVQYLPSDYATEKGLSIGNHFERQANEAVLDFTTDDGDDRPKKRRKWDRQKKKYVTDTSEETKRKKMIKTESGVWISASYKSNAYADWKNRNKTDNADDDDDDDDGGGGEGSGDYNVDDDRDAGHGNRNMRGGGGGKFKVVGYQGRNWPARGKTGESEVSNRQNKGKFKKERKSSDEIMKKRKQQAKLESMQNKKGGKGRGGRGGGGRGGGGRGGGGRGGGGRGGGGRGGGGRGGGGRGGGFKGKR